MPDGRDIFDELTARQVKLSLGRSVHDPTDPVGRLLFNVLAMVAEFEAARARARIREGMAVAKAKGRLRGQQPKLSAKQEAHLVDLWRGGRHTRPRARRVVQRGPLHRLPRDPARRRVRRPEPVSVRPRLTTFKATGHGMRTRPSLYLENGRFRSPQTLDQSSAAV